MKTLTFEMSKKRKDRNMQIAQSILGILKDAVNYDAKSFYITVVLDTWNDYVDIQLCNGEFKIISPKDEIIEAIEEPLKKMLD